MTCGWYQSNYTLADELSGISFKGWSGLRGYQARGNATTAVCRVTLVGGDDQLRRTFENLPSLLRPEYDENWKPGRRDNLSLATAAFPRNGNSSSDRSCGGGSNYDNGRHHVSQVRKMQPDGVRCSLPQTDEFTRGASSEKENAFKIYLGSSCNESNRDKMAAESVVTAASQRKLFPSTRILRLIPTNRSFVLSNAKRHRIPIAPQHTVKPQAGYVDPVIKCTSEFQQRLAELAVLQLETVRWEGQRKVRKKQADS